MCRAPLTAHNGAQASHVPPVRVGVAGYSTASWLYGGPVREPVPSHPEDWPEFYRRFFTALRSPDPSAHLPVPPQDVVHIAEVLGAAILSGTRRQVVRLRA